MIEGWNAGRLEDVFATWDRDVVARTDPTWPERICFGRDSAERFWHSVRETLGTEPVIVEEEYDLGDRALWRICQPVSSASGVRGTFSWSFLITVRSGRVIMVELFIDDAAARADLGIASRAPHASTAAPD
jgi:ketosteroid isomerase-like protein